MSTREHLAPLQPTPDRDGYDLQKLVSTDCMGSAKSISTLSTSREKVYLPLYMLTLYTNDDMLLPEERQKAHRDPKPNDALGKFRVLLCFLMHITVGYAGFV